ncbi:MAG: LysM peptidoglycan-binding domain-containing protein, partial [Nitrospirae bacterium]|nr:LysM peptidoglycan-binding domain-containing protein [Nitrospirota bacterium]
MKRIFAFITLFLFLTSAAYAGTTYTVKNGDSLYKISKKFDVPESELKRINALKTNKLRVGQKIRIKNADRKLARKNLLKDKSQEDIEKTYTVKKGDTIYRIAKRFDISVEELKELNELRNNSLKVGQTLIISEKTEEPVEPEDIIKSIQVQYDRKAAPVITSMRIEEVKELSDSKDLSKMSIKDRLMLFAKKMLHLPYKFGGNGVIGLDCSAYVQKVYGITGITIPRSAREQFRVGEPVDKEELSIGDLVFFRT